MEKIRRKLREHSNKNLLLIVFQSQNYRTTTKTPTKLKDYLQSEQRQTKIEIAVA
jgi:hypothetical protein